MKAELVMSLRKQTVRIRKLPIKRQQLQKGR